MSQSTVPRPPLRKESSGGPSSKHRETSRSPQPARRRRDDPRLRGGITFRHKLRRDYPLILMTLPVLILLAVFAY
ncbi:sugar ABC transporter permease, partial [Streptomyces sp. B6B3]